MIADSLRRYAEVYSIMLRNSLIREMNFKTNFLLWMVVEFLWFLGQIVFIEVLFGYVESIGTWTKWEVVMLVGTHQLVGQIFQAFFYVNLADISELVRTGKLDFLLLQPLDSQFAISTRRFGLDNLVNAAIGIGFVIFAMAKLGLEPTYGQIALYAIAVVLGVVIHYCILCVLAATAFWLVHAQGVIYGYYSLFTIGRYPDVIFRGLFKFVFSWIVPVIVVANVPTRVFIHAGENPWELLWPLAAAAALAAVFTRLFWLAAVRRYASASS